MSETTEIRAEGSTGSTAIELMGNMNRKLGAAVGKEGQVKVHQGQLINKKRFTVIREAILHQEGVVIQDEKRENKSWNR